MITVVICISALEIPGRTESEFQCYEIQKHTENTVIVILLCTVLAIAPSNIRLSSEQTALRMLTILICQVIITF